ncbi:MAG: PqqD family protein [Bacteroidia bacterium]|nr:PqqD family protein [Bacteroidia bacterium]
MVNENIKYIRKKELLSSRMDNEIVMMHPESGKYFALNPVAARIWELMETEHSIIELVDKLQREFDVDSETCKNEVTVFIENVLEKKLIDVSK